MSRNFQGAGGHDSILTVICDIDHTTLAQMVNVNMPAGWLYVEGTLSMGSQGTHRGNVIDVCPTCVTALSLTAFAAFIPGI